MRGNAWRSRGLPVPRTSAVFGNNTKYRRPLCAINICGSTVTMCSHRWKQRHAGGVILHARDACYRDMASMHGNYRRVEETIPAITLLGELLAEWSLESCHWLFDQPVSNSGRLKSMLLTMAQQRRLAMGGDAGTQPRCRAGQERRHCGIRRQPSARPGDALVQSCQASD